MASFTPLRDGLTLYIETATSELRERHRLGELGERGDAERLIRDLALPFAEPARSHVESELWFTYAADELLAVVA